MSLLPPLSARRLLVGLWLAVASCPASAETAGRSGADVCAVGAALEPLWTAFGQSAAAAVLPLTDGLARLESRLNGSRAELHQQLHGVQTQLAGQLQQLQSRLDAALGHLSAVRDCSDLAEGSGSGIYLVQPGLGRPVPVYCDMDTDGGGWTVFQRRADIQPRQDFFADWQAYKWGLGRLDGEFWWGLEHIWLTTSLLDRQYDMRIDLEDFDDEKRYAHYEGFRLSPEADGYRLTLSNFTGNGGDSLGDRSGTRFSTKDRDQDTHADSCAKMFKGGWWYTACHASNLNGLYLSGEHTTYADGINWFTWRGHHYSLKAVEMKFRPGKKL